MFSEAQGYILVDSARPSHYLFPWSGFFPHGLLQLLPGSTQRLVPGIFLPHGLFSWVRYWQDFTKVHPPWYHNQWEIYTFLYKGDSEAAPLPSFFLTRHLSFPVLFPLSGSVRADQHIYWPDWTIVEWIAHPPSLLWSPISDIYQNSEGEIKARTPPQVNYLELIFLPLEVKLKAGDCPIFVFLSLKKPWRPIISNHFVFNSYHCLAHVWYTLNALNIYIYKMLIIWAKVHIDVEKGVIGLE